ncbi:Xaa-Pro peptidase family protein [Halapricum hydrolyticum]|uniref:Xaa-Pro peptidase family protein n=1 Tax=Halapricum hydrolyticum TaxID=2979991 RepID=A0AAE3LE52_9EURY|nr:Xaa-Pro peptidase family protein [Halapricum hydrolyticum]MCU4717045.1 Xaa-Pro peptidase family protein [Halapricum hydrolyticum]MCU4725971.1 Xaa-Pro peptidase family protein [Halapricum hydrolyticum]
MELDLSKLDARLDDLDADGYLVDADSTDADQYYLSGFDAPDPFLTLYDGSTHLLFVRSLEFGRAKRESRAETVERFTDYGYDDRLDEYGRQEAAHRTRAAFLDAYDVDTVAVPPRFPLQTADGLREQGIDVLADGQDTLAAVRASKTDEEISHVRAAQEANEAAMAAAEELLGRAEIDGNRLRLDGEVLTSERLKEEIEVTLLRRGCALDETIVACGSDAADPHDRGSGPLAPDEPIIVDIFPQDKATKYHGDMTRTFCVGEPDEQVREWYDLTERAYRAALDAVEPGATGADVHDVVCDVYEDADLPTLRDDPGAETGFIHSTGHGVGLDVHELPSVGPDGGELEPGHVITIEPGLYDPEVGGVRIEDLVVVTDDGYENLTDYPVSLVVE